MRKLTDNEYNRLEEYFKTNGQLRDLTMFSIQRWAGYRIKEVLSLKLSDLYAPDGSVKQKIYIKPRQMKGSKTPRVIPIHSRLQKVLIEYRDYLESKDSFKFKQYAFQSRKGDNQPITTVQAWRIMKKACNELDLYENVATHSLRKTFCTKVYKASGNDIVATQHLMGHKDPMTTLHYLAQNQEKLDEVVLGQ